MLEITKDRGISASLSLFITLFLLKKEKKDILKGSLKKP